MDLVGFALVHDASGLKGSNSNSQANAGMGLLIAGTSCIISSIPIFILSSENKRKARELTVKMQQVDRLRSNTLYTFNYPALTVKIHL